MGIHRCLSKSKALAIIVLIWTAAIAIPIPWWFVFQLVSLPGPVPLCYEAWSNPISDRIYFLSVHFLGCFSIPLIIILNGIVWHNVNTRPIIPNNWSVPTTLNSVQLVHETTKVRVLRKLSVLTLALFLSWLPFYVVMTRLKFFGHSNKIESPVNHYVFQVIMIPIAQLLGSTNSCLNPGLYAFLKEVSINAKLHCYRMLRKIFKREVKSSTNSAIMFWKKGSA